MADALPILFEDNHCLAVAKPAPLLTQAPPGVPSLESLRGNTTLSYLDISYSKVADVRPIATMTSLETVSARGLGLKDLAFVAPLFALASLDVADNDVLSIAQLSGAKRLVSLTLAGTKVRDLRPLEGLPTFQILDLARTPVTDLSPLAKARALHSLTVPAQLPKAATDRLVTQRPALRIIRADR